MRNLPKAKLHGLFIFAGELVSTRFWCGCGCGVRVEFGQFNPDTLTAVEKTLGKKKSIFDDVKSTKLEKSTEKREEKIIFMSTKPTSRRRKRRRVEKEQFEREEEEGIFIESFKSNWSARASFFLGSQLFFLEVGKSTFKHFFLILTCNYLECGRAT